MLQALIGLIVSVVIAVNSCEMPRRADKAALWADPAGDAAAFAGMPERPVLDIVGIRAEGRDGSLHLTTRVRDGLEGFFAYTDRKGNKYGDVLVEFFIDSDNDPATGGSPMWRDEADRRLEGYDYSAYVALGFHYFDRATGSGRLVSGSEVLDTSVADVTGGLATFSLWRVLGEFSRQGVLSEPGRMDSTFEDFTILGYDSVEIRIPYPLLGVKKGDTIRLCYKEVAQSSASAEGISDDRYLVLR